MAYRLRLLCWDKNQTSHGNPFSLSPPSLFCPQRQPMCPNLSLSLSLRVYVYTHNKTGED